MTPWVGIIAAGEGSRLAQSRPGIVKPMIPIAGRPLCHWIVDGLRATGCLDATVLTNTRGAAVAPSLAAAFPDVRFDFVAADTASSFESFRLVSLRLAAKADAFMISTVDALIPPTEIVHFWKECLDSRAEAGLALTAHVDDEKPLWADVSANGLISSLGDDSRKRNAVTCGLYYMTRDAAGRLPAAPTHGRLRDFWTTLVRSGADVRGVMLSKTLDVDRPQDLTSAEEFLTQEKTR